MGEEGRAMSRVAIERAMHAHHTMHTTLPWRSIGVQHGMAVTCACQDQGVGPRRPHQAPLPAPSPGSAPMPLA